MPRMFDRVAKFFKQLIPEYNYVSEVNVLKSNIADSRVKDYLKAYEQISWVYSAVKLISQSVASATWRLYDITGEEWEEINAHEFLTLINKPNKFLSRYELFFLTAASLELTGEALWFLAKKGNRILGIFPLNPVNLEIELEDGLPKRYVYNVRGKKQVLNEDEIIFFKYPNPSNPYRGLSPLKAIAVSADTDFYASIWNRNFFINSATPSAVLEAPAKLTKKEIDMLKEELRNFYRGLDKSHETLILSGGLQFKPIQLSQKDIQFLELRRFTRSEIAAAFGVPLSKLGISEEVNRATAYINDYTFAKNTITPKLTMLRDALNNFLTANFGEGLYYDFDSVIPQDEEFQTQKYLNFVKTGILTINEVRQELGYPEVPWGDTPFNTQLLINYGFENVVKKDKPKSVFKSKIDKLIYWKALVEKKQKIEDNFKGKLINFFERQRKVLLNRLSEYKGFKGKEKISQSEVEKILDELLSVIYSDTEINSLQNIYVSEQAKNFLASSKEMASDFGLAMYFENIENYIQDIMNERAQRFAKQISDTTFKKLKQSLMEGWLKGEGERELAERVNDVMTLSKRQRAATIARTETFSVVNESHIETMKINGIEWKEWLTAGDERVRTAHAQADGQMVRTDDYFNVDGEYLMYPGDPKGSPANIINCRCVSVPVIS